MMESKRQCHVLHTYHEGSLGSKNSRTSLPAWPPCGQSLLHYLSSAVVDSPLETLPSLANITFTAQSSKRRQPYRANLNFPFYSDQPTNKPITLSVCVSWLLAVENAGDGDMERRIGCHLPNEPARQHHFIEEAHSKIGG